MIEITPQNDKLLKNYILTLVNNEVASEPSVDLTENLKMGLPSDVQIGCKWYRISDHHHQVTCKVTKNWPPICVNKVDLWKRQKCPMNMLYTSGHFSYNTTDHTEMHGMQPRYKLNKATLSLPHYDRHMFSIAGSFGVELPL